MTTNQRRRTERPTCPFCRADWTDGMLEQYDSHTVRGSCACCPDTGDTGDTGDSAQHGPSPAVSVPVSDICCAACGRALYLAPASAS
ncbi:MAG: hypothetical protein JWN59_780 [Sphingomonas bacterium]|nr:hypothetical protein [Sphingomonas bacterium]